MSDMPFRIGVIATVVLVALAIVRFSFCHQVDLPPIPPRPEPPRVEVAEVTASVNSDPGIFAELLAKDSRTLRIEPPTTPADLSRAFTHERWEEGTTLSVRGKSRSTEVLGLRLVLSLQDIEGTPQRQMVLTIKNTTDAHLAYRIQTQPTRGANSCSGKSDFAHNAVALAPGETIRRAECIYKSGSKLRVSAVDTVQLPALSYFYVSQLPPSALGLELRTARGHRSAAGRQACQVFKSAVLEEDLRSGRTGWIDLVDFYARHPCTIYSFPNGYKAFQSDGERPLPVTDQAP